MALSTSRPLRCGIMRSSRTRADVGLALEHVERLAAVVRERDAKRALLELHLDDAADVRLVVGDEHVDTA